jgi:Fur family iron response transcriptional regulator
MLYVPPPEMHEDTGQIPTAAAERVLRAMLQGAGLRPTRQRLVIADALFSGGPKHLTADELFQSVLGADSPLSLATVYNTLNQFAEAGLIRRVAVNGGRTYFDTDVTSHNHFYIESEGRLIDIEAGAILLGALPPPPPGYEIRDVDVVVRLRECAGKTLKFSHTKACSHETD